MRDLPAEFLKQPWSREVLFQNVGVLVERVGVDEDSEAIRLVAWPVDGQIASQIRLADLSIDQEAAYLQSVRQSLGNRVGRSGPFCIVIRAGGE